MSSNFSVFSCIPLLRKHLNKHSTWRRDNNSKKLKQQNESHNIISKKSTATQHDLNLVLQVENKTSNLNDEDQAHVIDGFRFVKQGSLVMVLKNPETKSISIGGTDDWRFCNVSDDNYYLHFGQGNSICIQDIKRIETLTDVDLTVIENTKNKNAETDLTINCKALKFLILAIYFEHRNCNNNAQLQHMSMATTMTNQRKDSCVYLLWDSYQTAYIWYQTLQMMSSNTSLTNIFSYQLLVSNRSRIGMAIPPVDLMEMRNGNNMLCLIRDELQVMVRQINKMSLFVAQYCILDSTFHLSMLSQVKEMSLKLHKMEEYICRIETSNSALEHTLEDKDKNPMKRSALQERWQCLQVDFTLCCLKYKQLKFEIEINVL